jgi:hypothetical protein
MIYFGTALTLFPCLRPLSEPLNERWAKIVDRDCERRSK